MTISLTDDLLPKHLRELNPDMFLGNKFMVCDFETTTKNKGSPLNPANELVLSHWLLYENGKIVRKKHWGGELDQLALMKDIDNAEFVVCHGTHFELGWLQRMGYPTHTKAFYCTLLGQRVLAGNRAWMKLSLSETAKYYGVTDKLDCIKPYWSAGVETTDIPAEFLDMYCAGDVQTTLEVFLEQRLKLSRMKLLPTVFTRCIFTPVLQDMSRNGMCLDSEAVLDEYNLMENAKLEIDKEMDTLTGGINPRSSKQVCTYLYDVLGFTPVQDRKGQPIRKANALIMAQLRATTPQQKEFLQLKSRQSSIDSALSKTLRPFAACVKDAEKEGKKPIINFMFSQIVAATHRLSSTGYEYKAQGQNIPRKYKKLITARSERYKVVEGDAAQLEFRVAAHLGLDARAIQDIRNGEDVHSFTAAIIFGKKKLKMSVEDAFKWITENKDTDKVAKELRQQAKPLTFRPLEIAA